jgi:hypothetical protein
MQSDPSSSSAAAGSGPEHGAATSMVWPLCPACGRPRHTACPLCGTAGQSFARADEEYFADPLPAGTTTVRVICSTCDEPFAAQFLRRCQWCGHDFGEGLLAEIPARIGAAPEPLNGRALFVALGLLAVVTLVVVYLALILRE